MRGTRWMSGGILLAALCAAGCSKSAPDRAKSATEPSRSPAGEKSAVVESAPPAPPAETPHAPRAPRRSIKTEVVTKKTTPALTWNAWVEGDTAFQPVPVLQPKQNYNLVIDFSALTYGIEEGGDSQGLGLAALRAIDQWKKNPSARNGKFTILCLPDSTHFAKPAARSMKMSFALSRLNDWSALVADAGPAPLQILAVKPDASFRLDHVTFPIRTTAESGSGRIGISFWANGERPVDEMVLHFCIAGQAEAVAKCSHGRGTESLRGIDSVRAAFSDTDDGKFLPDAALHFVQLDGDEVIGVMRRKSWEPGRFEVWPVASNAKLFRANLDQITNQLSETTATDALLVQGEQLYDLLFPNTEEPGASEFRSFVAEHLAREAAEDERHRDAPSIFIRMITADDPEPMLAPLGLVAMRQGGAAAEFLGNHFRIETPLAFQNYEPAPQCISNWTWVVPSLNEDLQEARKIIDRDLGEFRQGLRREFFSLTKLFQEYLGAGTEADPAAVVVVSHHDSGRLWMNQNDKLVPSGIVRRFQRPSLAILDSCTTAPKATLTSFASKFAERGMASVIATSTKISPEMQASYLTCLAKAIGAEPEGVDYPLSYLHLEAVRCLSATRIGNREFGSQALTYSLIGNGNLRVCRPQKGTP